MNRAKSLIVSGPTASGKTALAVVLARYENAIVVNADSMQVYSDVHCLSARPTEAETQGVPHFLFGHVDGGVPYNVGLWLQDVAELRSVYPDRAMIFCGGTGLYLKALTEGFTDTPIIPQAIRDAVLEDFNTMGQDAFVQSLLQREPNALAHIVQAPDYQRILRAAEVVYTTQKPLIYWHQEHQTAPLLPDARQLALCPDRALLYQRIDARCAKMFDTALQEVSTLLTREYAQTQPVMRCIGVALLAEFLDNKRSREDVLAQFSRDTRRYAKRQLTWLRHQMKPDQYIHSFGDEADLTGGVWA